MSTRAREVKSEAIILHSRTFLENDLLVDFLTPQFGRLTGIARHGRKSRKRFGTLLESCNVLELRYRATGHFVSLEEATQALPLYHLRESLEQLSTSFYLIDLVRKVIPQGGVEGNLYHLLKRSLSALNQGNSLPQVVTEFERCFLEISGYEPQLTACLACGKKWQSEGHQKDQNNQEFYFVFREGGLFCAECAPSGLPSEPYSVEHLPSLLSHFIEYQMGFTLKSRQFLTEIGGLN